MRNLEGKLEKAILKTLTEGKKVSFTHLLEECRKTQPSLSKATLTKYLKILLLKNEIDKRFDAEHFKGYYQIAEKGILKLMVESWIQKLGLIAVYYIVERKLRKRARAISDIKYEIEKYLKIEPEKDSLWTWEQLFEFLETEYPLTI